ncbi:hypothetical protein E3O19_06075 [Cryobacterium algoritolerans]|uniref:Uncharacterized protein n=1 Tax=Cryobacterium algoritolerans TaxID=1259184 RepID=A0A4R8WZT7_9MICO|nr:hypothetical protein [Cryobacterium algoritolerans]TFC17447.1 hypothetical protein E3O19_06075 [Cryobacterium algoritolerans]
MSTGNDTTGKFYEHEGTWIYEFEEGDDVVKRQFTADPRLAGNNARLDTSTRIFSNGSWQTTWYDANGVPTVDTVES